MMMAHSCQIGDESDEDGDSNSYLAENGKGWMTGSLFCPQTTMATKSSPARLGDHHLGAVGVELSPQVLMLQGHLGDEEEIRWNWKIPPIYDSYIGCSQSSVVERCDS